MSTAETKIQWTDRTWNPVRGCSRISPGCGGAKGAGGCYAEKVAGRFAGPGLPYEGLATIGKQGARWTGKVVLVPDALNEPLHWRKPQRIFVNSMSDLFHEGLTNEEIAAVFGVMAACPQHTFQVLTKRAERMAAWFEWVAARARSEAAPGRNRQFVACEMLIAAEKMLQAVRGDEEARQIAPYEADEIGWPLPNVHIGVSVEDQQRADERIPHLLRVPAAVRFLSVEPQLGPVDLHRAKAIEYDSAGGEGGGGSGSESFARGLVDWVIVGGESGRGARPFDLAWARTIVAQCTAAGVPVFVKQLGRAPFFTAPVRRGEELPTTVACRNLGDGRWQPLFDHPKGGELNEWPDDLRVRQFPAVGGAS